MLFSSGCGIGATLLGICVESNMWRLRIFLFALLTLVLIPLIGQFSGPVARAEGDAVIFAVWLEELRAEALEQGISAATLDVALAGVKPIPRVIELDRGVIVRDQARGVYE